MSLTGAGASEGIAREALERNLWALWSRFGRGEGYVLHEEEDALFFDTPIPILPFNAALRFSVVSDVDRRIDAIFEHYRQDGVPVSKVLLNLAAGAAGYRLGVLHSTPVAVDLYGKIGSREIAPFSVFAPPQAFHA